ncbi:MAG: hypothetical protein CVV63_00260 [Tenericutes bacterium HGW-Tenericutes-8]|nr:MAG: hypothetical protein CVV63_00260 [Tenericutes bacterium HGW-Tenericutes-8]PKK96933.1 MAG: hypothetical protein CVV58_03820 [Tenericutes bacterium HGW-Tenericutes-3]
MKTPLKKEYLRYISIDILIGVALSGLMLLYSQNFTLIGFIDAILVGGFLLFTIGWFIYISNNNIFDVAIYGVQSFWRGVFGKRMKKTYIEHLEDKTQVKPSIYRSLWYSSIPLFIADFILYLIYLG